MLRRLNRWQIAALTVALILAIVFAGSYLFAPEYQVCHPNDYDRAKDCSYYHFGPSVLATIIAWADIHNGLVTAIATAFLTIITWRLSRLESDAAETKKAELRAYPVAMPKGLSVNHDGGITVYVEVRNAGQTPAFNTKVPAGIVIRADWPDHFSVGDLQITDKQIAELPSVTLSKGGAFVIAPTRNVSAVELAKAANEKERFYAFGMIGYQDIFGEDNWAEFCTYLDVVDFLPFYAAAKSSSGKKIDMTMKVAEFGNDTSLNPEHRDAMNAFHGRMRNA